MITVRYQYIVFFLSNSFIFLTYRYTESKEMNSDDQKRVIDLEAKIASLYKTVELLQSSNNRTEKKLETVVSKETEFIII
jgi:hypothetical protein